MDKCFSVVLRKILWNTPDVIKVVEGGAACLCNIRFHGEHGMKTGA